MKSMLPGYYQPTGDEFKNWWQTGLFVLDANILLNLYRYHEAAREDLLRLLSTISDQLWLPHQAALEYLRNRQTVIEEHAYPYKKALDALGTFGGQIRKALDDYHRSIDIESVVRVVTDALEPVKKQISEWQDKHPHFLEEDGILPRVTVMFDGKVGSPYPEDELAAIYQQGDVRFPDEIPPGYKDVGSKSQRLRKYGDLVLWFQIIDHAKQTKKPIILVMDEKKEDWWLKKGNNISGPRPELINEMHEKAGVPFYMYRQDRFLHYLKVYMNQTVEPETVEEVTRVAKEDEERAEREARQGKSATASLVQASYAVEGAVLRWLNWLPSVAVVTDVSALRDRDPGVDFVVEWTDGGSSGVIVKYRRVSSKKDLTMEATIAAQARAWDSIILIVVTDSSELAQLLFNMTGVYLRRHMSVGVDLVAGYIDEAGYFQAPHVWARRQFHQ